MLYYLFNYFSLILLLATSVCNAFLIPNGPTAPSRMISLFEQIKGDTLRENNGVRPSMHPITINAIADLLKQRASGDLDMEPLQVALFAGRIVAEALAKREESSGADGMSFDSTEQQTIAGRVVGVTMRFDALEKELYEKTSSVGWVKKFDEWASFGVLETDENSKERIKTDPLFAMNRAECLLALFIQTVEAPQLEKIGRSVPDGSKIDFIDQDRKEVLLV